MLVTRSEQRPDSLADELEPTHPALSATIVAADLFSTDAPAAVTDKLEQAGSAWIS